jgi:hypothetical protein
MLLWPCSPGPLVCGIARLPHRLTLRSRDGSRGLQGPHHVCGGQAAWRARLRVAEGSPRKLDGCGQGTRAASPSPPPSHLPFFTAMSCLRAKRRRALLPPALACPDSQRGPTEVHARPHGRGAGLCRPAAGGGCPRRAALNSAAFTSLKFAPPPCGSTTASSGVCPDSYPNDLLTTPRTHIHLPGQAVVADR